MPIRQRLRALTRPGKARRAGWNIVDQALSALTNVVLAFVVARSVDAQGFGVFSIAFLIFSLVIGVERSLVGQPLAMRHSHETAEQQRATVRLAFGTSLGLSLLVSVGALAVGLVLGGTSGHTLVALAVVLPFLILQDCARMAFFAWARPREATINDAIWAVVQFALIGVVVAAGKATPASLVLCWGAGAVVGFVVAVKQLHGWPAVRGVLGWARGHRDVAGLLFIEYLVGIGAFQGGLLLIGASLGVGNIGALRAAQVLMGPIGILSGAGMTFGVPEVARRASLHRNIERYAWAASASLVGITGLYVVVLLLIPDGLGRTLLGDTWTGASSVLLPVALASVVGCAKLGPAVVTYGLGLAHRTIWLVSGLGIIAVVYMAVGAWLDGAQGLAWGLAAAQASVVPFWYALLHKAVRSGVQPAGATAAETPAAPEDLEAARSVE